MHRRVPESSLMQPCASGFAAKNSRLRRPVSSPSALDERRELPAWTMKAKIIITPKKAVVDPQGKTVQNALAQMGYTGVAAVHVGKYVEIDLAPGTDPEAARKALDEASHKFLSNPIIEDYQLVME
jgi:phosphoribosylformylglycinamidine synthase subunit PurS